LNKMHLLNGDPNFQQCPVFLVITLWSYIYIIFQRKGSLRSHKISKNQGFSHYFCLMIEESGSGSVPRTGNGYGRPKIRVLRIRIRNTALLWLVCVEGFFNLIKAVFAGKRLTKCVNYSIYAIRIKEEGKLAIFKNLVWHVSLRKSRGEELFTCG
jgi:hypothetical protein